MTTSEKIALVTGASRGIGYHAALAFAREVAARHADGSALPLVLIAASVSLKYVVGIELALQPQTAQQPAFALTVCAVYGALTGLFAARALALWRMAAARH